MPADSGQSSNAELNYTDDWKPYGSELPEESHVISRKLIPSFTTYFDISPPLAV